MPIIPYNATNFSGPYAHLNGNGQITATWPQLVWAAITVGKAAGDENAYGIYSALEHLHRASMMWAYLIQASTGRLHRTGLYNASDPSEKTSISFYIGLILAKLFADVLFNVPRMLHFAVYGNQYNVTTAEGDSRPDLIGISTNGQWFVFEAKGRTNGFDNLALTNAKLQAEQIVLIDNLPPACRIASESYFSASGMQVRMDDPELRDGRSRNIKITREQFEGAYYTPIRNILKSRESFGRLAFADRRFRGTRIEEADLWIALPAEGEPTADQPTLPADLSGDFLGNDQVWVGLGPSWSEANMRLEPRLRSN